jgi:hypothetical protein
VESGRAVPAKLSEGLLTQQGRFGDLRCGKGKERNSKGLNNIVQFTDFFSRYELKQKGIVSIVIVDVLRIVDTA